MAVISITIEESAEQLVAGIPRTVTIETNIVATIFFTLDGTIPTVSSLVYVGPIALPTNNSSVTLNVMATNGVDTSAIVSNTYSPEITGRMSHDTISGLDTSINPSPLFTDNGINNYGQYGGSGGLTVDDPDIVGFPDGYDGTATNTYSNSTDEPLDKYKMIWSRTNSKGETGPGIGTMPANVTIRVPDTNTIASSTNDRIFNPRAMVIHQDSRNNSEENPPQINRMAFSLQNLEKTRDGAVLMNTAFENSYVTGSFVRQYYNNVTNEITYYYRDSDSGRWIISVEPFTPKPLKSSALANIAFSSRNNGAGYVFKWIPFMSRKII